MKKSELILSFANKFPYIAKLVLRIWAYTYIIYQRQEHWLFFKLKDNVRYRFKYQVNLLHKYPIFVDPFDIIGNSILKNGCYEKDTVKLFQHLLSPGMVVIDVGAHIGQYTILSSQILKNTGKVHAFEPDPNTFKQLLENLELNAADNVVANNLALSDFAGTGTLYISDSSRIPGGSSLKPQKGFDGDKVEVKIISLDEYAKNVNLSRIDLIKADVEGAELLFLKGGEDSITKYRPLIIMELSTQLSLPFGYRKDDVYNKLLSWGYRIYKIGKLPLKIYNINSGDNDPPFFNVLCAHNSCLYDLKKRGILDE